MLRACLRAASASLPRTAERRLLVNLPSRALSNAAPSKDAAEAADVGSDGGDEAVGDGDGDCNGAFKRRDIAATVNSMRLDAIGAQCILDFVPTYALRFSLFLACPMNAVRAGFGISRNRAEIDILSGMCTLNGQLMRVKDKQVRRILDNCLTAHCVPVQGDERSVQW